MNNKFFIITVFISNIAFGAVLPKIELQNVVNTKNTNNITAQISAHLFNKGLEKNIAQAKVDNSLANNAQLNDLMVHNIVKTIETINEKDVVHFLAHSALKGKKVDLSAYSTLVSLVQKSSHKILDKETLIDIEKVSFENERLKAMKVFA